jgi:hypothetical protein
VTFEFFGDGSISVGSDRPAGRTLADFAADALAEEPMTLADLIKAIKEDGGGAVSEDVLRMTLKRHTPLVRVL